MRNFTLYPSSELSEVVQDVFLKVWESKEILDADKNFDGFLFMITRNIIFNYSRRYFIDLNFRMTALRGIEESYEIEEELDAVDLKIILIVWLRSFLPRDNRSSK